MPLDTHNLYKCLLHENNRNILKQIIFNFFKQRKPHCIDVDIYLSSCFGIRDISVFINPVYIINEIETYKNTVTYLRKGEIHHFIGNFDEKDTNEYLSIFDHTLKRKFKINSLINQ